MKRKNAEHLFEPGLWLLYPDKFIREAEPHDEILSLFQGKFLCISANGGMGSTLKLWEATAEE